MTNEPNEGRDRPDAKAAWGDAGERLGGLGARLKQHYQDQHAQTAPSEPAGSEVKEAAKRLNQAVHTAFEALASASKDQAVKDDARRAGRSVADALAGTFAGISEELNKAFGGSSKPGPSASGSPAPAWSPAPAAQAPAGSPAPAAQADPEAPDYGTPAGSGETSSPAPASESEGTPSAPAEGRPEGTPEGRPPGTPDPDSPESGPPAP